MPNNNQFTFEISLSVLDHLGRNLYRSFATVLGEAISNAWDADAKNVWLYVDRENNNFFIKDDGDGMTQDDFQNKFLRIGYSKRRDGGSTSSRRRPYIGRKGIGKLALLSCAEKITVISKTQNTDYIGGTIDNSGLDRAITDDLTPQDYRLENWDQETFGRYTENHQHGTIIYFENIKNGIRNNLDFLKKTIALYFRFSLLDSSFNIFINDEIVSYDCLNDLAQKTEFLWKINEHDDPYIQNLQSIFTTQKNEQKQINLEQNIKGFIASVNKPRNLKVISTDERVTVDLFVNGRLRERDILKHIPTARVIESYLYGQIHYNDLDDEVDRFTSSRESIVADDPKFNDFINIVKNNLIGTVFDDWDAWRRKHRKDGDPENTNISSKERKAEELYNAVSEEYDLPESSENKERVDDWIGELLDDAKYNFSSYAECFISENLIRKYIQEENIQLTPEAQRDITDWKNKENQNKRNGNISIELRKDNTDLSYLDMNGLAHLVDNQPNDPNCLPRDTKQYKPIRDALMHTARLTDEAKRKLTTVYENIKARIKNLLTS